MTNDYFAARTPIGSTAKANSSQLNELSQAVFDAFEKLPSRDAMNQGRLNYGTDSGSANSHSVSMGVNPTSYVEGLSVRFVAAATNTGASTINVGGLGARAIKRADGVDLSAGDIVAGQLVAATYIASANEFRISTFLGSELVSATTAATQAASSASAASASAGSAATSASSAATSASNAAASAALNLTEFLPTSNRVANDPYSDFDVQVPSGTATTPANGQIVKINVHESRTRDFRPRIRLIDGANVGSHFEVLGLSGGNNQVQMNVNQDEHGRFFINAQNLILRFISGNWVVQRALPVGTGADRIAQRDENGRIPEVGMSLIASQSFSSGVDEIVFTGLSGYREIIVDGDGITLATATAVRLMVSDDAGVSWKSDTPGFTAVFLNNGTDNFEVNDFLARSRSSDGEISLYAHLRAFNDPANPVFSEFVTGSADNGNTHGIARAKSNFACDALRVMSVSGALFTGFNIRLYGVR